jgi:hypothetical protein
MSARPAVRALVCLLALTLLLATPAVADAKARPKPKDRVAPTSTLTTADGAVMAPVPGVGPLAGIGEVRGHSSDTGSGVEAVFVTYIREVNGVVVGMVAFEWWITGCEGAPKVCEWSVPVPGPFLLEDPVFFVLVTAPIEYLLYTPGQWHVGVNAVDRAGNQERHGPEIDILVA